LFASHSLYRRFYILVIDVCLVVVLADPVPECWLDINEVLPCGKASDQLFTGQTNDGDVPASEFGIQLCNVEADCKQLPEVSISELESLLLMDSNGQSAGGYGQMAGYITVDTNDLEESVHDSTVTQFDSVHHIEEEEPAADVSEDLSSPEEDDIRDVTWSYCTCTARARRRSGRQRSKPGRRLSMAGSSRVDERKKQQNKSAATRYREKKRTEELVNEMLCAELEKRNKELRTRVDDMTREVAVLRQLVVDIFRSPNVCSA